MLRYDLYCNSAVIRVIRRVRRTGDTRYLQTRYTIDILCLSLCRQYLACPPSTESPPFENRFCLCASYYHYLRQLMLVSSDFSEANRKTFWLEASSKHTLSCVYVCRAFGFLILVCVPIGNARITLDEESKENKSKFMSSFFDFHKSDSVWTKWITVNGTKTVSVMTNYILVWDDVIFLIPFKEQQYNRNIILDSLLFKSTSHRKQSSFTTVNSDYT